MLTVDEESYVDVFGMFTLSCFFLISPIDFKVT